MLHFIFGREITVGFNDDSDIFIVKLCSGSYESAGGIVIHKDLHVVDHDGNSVAHLYAIGNCANALDGVVEGSENAWAFVSGKMVADALSEE